MVGDAPAAAEELTVYTAVEADDLKKYAERFNADHPDIEIKWVRDSTGIVTAKLLAEKDNPQADIVWGLAATSLMLLKNEGMLEPYAPAGVDQLDAKFVDQADPPAWTGMDAWAAVICFNTVEAERLGLPRPTSWQDLLDPVYQGQIVMPNPNSSGTGYLDVSSWLQLFGEDEGWAFMDAAAPEHRDLHPFRLQALHARGAPARCRSASRSSSAPPGSRRKARRSTSSCPRRASAGTWRRPRSSRAPTSSRRRRRSPTGRSARPPTSSTAKATRWSRSRPRRRPIPHMPENLADKMIDNDFEWAAANRERILAEWQTRYDSKSEPKS